MTEGFASVVNFNPTIAYFSMEIGLETDLPTYSGGLGILAGDTLKSCADLGLAVVGVSLIYHKGYFTQEIDANGEQVERETNWDPAEKLRLLPQKIILREIEGRDILVQGWLYCCKGTAGKEVPIVFLDTDLEGNAEQDRNLVSSLYGGDNEFRLKQEILLGIGGVKYLRALGFHDIKTFHMNEGHSSLLTLELLRESRRTIFETWDEDTTWDFEKVRSQCVFTTHTPVAAGHDVFSYDLMQKILRTGISLTVLKKICGNGVLNMTTLGLNLSRFANGVAKAHGDVSRNMFPTYQIDYITNGIHVPTWTHKPFHDLFDKYAKLWTRDPKYLRQAESIPCGEIWDAHMQCKRDLLDEVRRTTSVKLDPDVLTVGFARRSAAYKRATLMFNDLDRLISIAENSPGLQLVFSGKAHPRDADGKKNIKDIHRYIKEIEKRARKLKVVYLPNYNMRLGFLITGGVDLWVNTPIRPHEASGTSGMKAVLNGVLNLSILDGWWVEGCIEGVTGWAIGDLDTHPEMSLEELARFDARQFYDKLEKNVIPDFYERRSDWIEMQRHAISINASFFNSHRQVEQYVVKAYFYP
ncbi:MAG: alpha-glucan family phosphorylase [Nitrospinae bacterium]|nr:alpha-glucan family phosphorylase [Nitrospinota bacterium]